MTKKLTVKVAALGLCAIISGGLGISALPENVSASARTESASTDLENVTGRYDLDSVKEGLYNSSVTENFLSLPGEGTVIVELDGDSAFDKYTEKQALYTGDGFSEYLGTRAGKRHLNALSARQSGVLADMRAAGVDYEFRYAYTALANAFSVTVKYSDVKRIEKIDGVKSVYYSNKYEAPKVAVTTNDANVYKTGIYDSSDVAYKGEGMVVAVLDTGLDYTHEAFLTMPESGKWDSDYIADTFDKTLAKTSRMPEATAADVYVNEKVPYAFDYADNDCNVYPMYSTHGTHVAGIIAGKDDNKTFGDSTFVGVAPEAQLAIMKVFTDDLDSRMLGGADTADILAAINDCAVLGVDVINMSLGSTGGFSSEETETFLTKVYGEVEKMGISLVVAAGNEYSSGYGGGNGVNLAENPDSGTVGSPSTYYPALSVASINGQESPYMLANRTATDDGSVAFITNAVDTYSNDIEFTDELYKRFPEKVAADGSLTLDYIVIGGVGRSGNYTSAIRRAFAGGDILALVKRGDISFSEKVLNATEAGAAGVIVYNHLSGDITMSLADVEDPIPTCSINLNAGTAMVNGATSERGVSKGTVTLSREYTAGPFMSAFSGWGVTPDLKLKPEITAHGGEITSAVPGGYDTYSGTSMAAPNMAGAVSLLRQHIESTTGYKGTELNAAVNQRLMSTATIALNPDGNPYSPRKQGAGLADINAAINTQAFLRVPQGDGYSDKTKIELYDDPEREGVYDATFTVTNITGSAVKYMLGAYVFTETLAINKKTVEENAYMLYGNGAATADVSYTIGGKSYKCGDEITVPANGNLDISAKVTLGDEAKAYIEESFKNGMYVEGYFRLLKTDGGAYTDLSLPFLAFYGDWSDAPMMDYSVYELAVTDADTSIDEQDKPVASARATTPLGLYDDGQYIMPLGTYLYLQNEEDVEIFPDSKKAAISMYDDPTRRTIYQLYMIYGGLLRGAKTLHLTITDAVTGETVYDKTEYNQRKSYALGGNNVGSPISVEMNPYEWGLANNREYIFKMQGTIDWKDGKVDKDTFEFSFHVDYEAPSIESYSIRYDPYTENKVTKYRIYLDVNVYDNRYVQSLLPCYVKDNILYLLTEYPVPVYSESNSITKVSLDITDFYEDYGSEIYLGVEDYAMNQSLYHLNLVNATKYSDNIEFSGEGAKLVKTGTKTATSIINGEQVRNEYGTYNLTLAPNEAFKMTAKVIPEDTFAYKLDWSSSAESVATAYENEIFAKRAGTAIISVKDGKGLTKAQITVTVSGTPKSAPAPEKLSFRPIINKDKFVQNISVSNTTVELYPNTNIKLVADIEPWYATDVEFEWTSSNSDIVTVDDSGNMRTVGRGVAYVTASVKGYDRVSTTLRVSVVSEYRIVNYTLFEYHGSPDVVIPDELNIMYLDEDAFKDDRTITSLVLPKTLAEIPENAFKNCTALKSVTIPSETTVIGKSAFEGCVSLKTVNLRKFIDDETGDEMTGALTVGNRGFANCISLDTIVNPTRLTAVGREAFKGCRSLTDLDVTGVAVAYANAFENCTSLKNIKFSAFTNPSKEMFAGCTSLQSITYPMGAVADGMFAGCTNLSSVNFTNDLYSIGARAFENTALESIALDSGDIAIGENAFRGCDDLQSVALGRDVKVTFAGMNPFGGCTNFAEFTVDAGNALYAAENGILYNAAKTKILLVPEKITEIELPAGVTEIGANVFAGRSSLRSIDLSNVTAVGDYAFAETGLVSVTLGANLTHLGKGAFKGCRYLSAVDIAGAGITEIPDETFSGCNSLKEISLPAGTTTIGNGAFENSVLERIDFGTALQTIAGRAFRGTRLSRLVIPDSVKVIGDYAFANIPSLNTAAIPAIESMGDGAFENCPMLSGVTIADGARVIGDYAFAADGSTSALRTVTIPDSVKVIGNHAFYNCSKLTSVNLAHVTEIGNYAFAGSGIGTVTTSAATIGDFAFNKTPVTSAELSGTERVGVMAFADSKLETLSADSLKVIGESAFSGTRLTQITLPATLENYTYEKTVSLYSHSKEKFEDRVLMAGSFGDGAFANIPTLTEIKAAGNSDFFTVDGVLYSKTENGYSLVQYPANRAGEEYTVLDGTVRIEAKAFAGVKNLKKITLSKQLKSVGTMAFFSSSLKEYAFLSAAAPVLESTFINASDFDEKDILYTIFATESNLELGSQVFYANFGNYVALVTEAKNLNDSGHRYTAPSFGLRMSYPENGSGYDNLIWKSYFEESETTEYAAEENTLRAIDAIAALPSAQEIAGIATLDALNELSGGKVASARRYYNAVNDEKQLAFIKDYQKLLDTEKAVRDARARLGAPAKVSALRILSRPDKLRYTAGETLDVKGLRVVAVYDDTSEEEITGFTVDKTVLEVGDSRVNVSYGGASQYFAISVTRKRTYTLTFTGEGIDEFTASVTEGERAEEPETPVREGYTFDGWFVGEDKFDFTAAVDGDKTLTARWTEVPKKTDDNGCKSAADAGMAATVALAGAAAIWAAAAIKRRDNRSEKGDRV